MESGKSQCQKAWCNVSITSRLQSPLATIRNAKKRKGNRDKHQTAFGRFFVVWCMQRCRDTDPAARLRLAPRALGRDLRARGRSLDKGSGWGAPDRISYSHSLASPTLSPSLPYAPLCPSYRAGLGQSTRKKNSHHIAFRPCNTG